MISTGHNVTAGGGLGGSHVPLPTRTIRHRVPDSKPRGLDWSKHTAPVDHAAMAQARAIRVAPKPKPKRRSTARATSEPRFDVDEAVRLYETGLSCRAIGERLGVKGPSVYARLQQRGVAMRTPVAIDVTRVVELALQRVTVNNIARELGCADSAVRKHLRRAGIEPADGRANRVHNRRTDLDALPTEYLAGATIPALARKYDAGTRTVRVRLLAAGVALRDDRAAHSGGWEDNSRATRYRMTDAGVTAAQIREWARAKGWPTSSGGPPSKALLDAYLNESATTRRDLTA